MNTRNRVLAVIAVAPLLLMGCAKTTTSTPAAPPAAVAATGPSATAKMVCGPEISGDVAKILSLTVPPPTTTTWVDHLYTCTYHLSTGPLVLSVKESLDVPAATTYLTALRQRLGDTEPLTGMLNLGQSAYHTTGGRVLILKDNKTLQVDATGLPLTVGPHQQSRADIAYEVATDILGCWNEK